MNALPAILLACVVAVGCAVAVGANSLAIVGTKAEAKREVAASAPVIEDVFIEGAKSKRSSQDYTRE